MSAFSLEAARDVSETRDVLPRSSYDTNFEPRKERLDEVFKSIYTKAIQEAQETPSPQHTEIRDGKIIQSDDNAKPYMVDGELLPNTTYELNGTVYETDNLGRIIRCEAAPKRTPENPRDNAAQAEAGGKDRREGDQGGHILGRDLGGDGGKGNLVAMDSQINQSDYKKMEWDVKTSLDKGNQVTTQTEFSYSGDSQRPDKITVTLNENGEKKAKYIFDNNLDGSLLDNVKEDFGPLAAETVKQAAEAVNGTVSSIKIIYDKNGVPVGAEARITYVGEDGKNHRFPVPIGSPAAKPSGGNI